MAVLDIFEYVIRKLLYEGFGWSSTGSRGDCNVTINVAC